MGGRAIPLQHAAASVGMGQTGFDEQNDRSAAATVMVAMLVVVT
jgi:hypothetical protein